MNPILISEQKHLTEVQKLLNEEFLYLKSDIKKIEKNYADKLKEASETAKQDDAVEIIKFANKMMESSDYVFKRNFFERLENQIQNPYFARIDFKMKNAKDEIIIYIGKHSFLPKNSRYRISDWRAPISSLYYNYQEPTKNVQYDFIIPIKHQPWKTEHRIINGDLNLRRSIDLADGKISGVYDNNLRVDLLSEAIKHKTGGILEDIIRTIQTGQNEIIRSDPYKINVVQGTAGSGKTTIAIHRISYLFYTYKDEIKEDNTLLLSSSKVLVNYVAKTLPELEIYSLTRNTLSGYIFESFENNKISLDRKAFTSKRNGNGKDGIKNISEKISDFADKYKNKIYKTIESKDYFKTFEFDRYIKRMQNKPIYYQVRSLVDNLKEELDDLNENYSKKNIIIARKIDNLNIAIKEMSKMLGNLNPIKAYDQFIGLGKFNKNSIDIDELSIMYLLIDSLYGLEGKKFKHIVVDEGQDLSLINYMVIQNLSDSGGMTILGDLNQATEDEIGIEKWEDLAEIFAKGKITHHEIKISYRTTKQIIEFAKAILQKFPQFKHLPEAFRREGEHPILERVDNRAFLIRKIVEDINIINKDNRLRSIAIIETDPSNLNSTAHSLKSFGINYVLVDENFEEFSQSGIYLIPEKLAKGLEFDTVFLIDPNKAIFPQNPQSAKRLFVCCTRPINRLFIYSIGEINSLLL